MSTGVRGEVDADMAGHAGLISASTATAEQI